MNAGKAIHIQLNGDHVELCQLLKLAGIADSGGQGKHIVAAGEVRVDGAQELRKTAKIRSGQRVECRGVAITVGPAGS
jgi:ribosome-associated protein